MSTQFQQIRSIFIGALERPKDEWSSYLEEVAAGDAGLQEQVRILLNAHAEGTGLLDKAVQNHSPTLDHPISERPGDTIGPYKLLQQIGEGGMGVVYMAEQTEPIERRVALKIIKPGMDTRHVIARFEAERQALAMMDHPNIAKVLDAGVTETGRPYFVMELVKGTPITEYCDAHKIPPRERLKLVIPVSQAIQHAHNKGIIHRDIKPSNVLVAHYDDRPVPRVIDFGVAKAIDHRLTEKTMFTEFGQVLGTFEYMSPEQARLNQWDVDTRTDVYSLGVLLYELLSGDTPFDRQRLRSAAFDELLRIMREEDPPRLSTRASTSQSLPTIADNRRTEPAKLGASIRGELDWIVMKALEKDRTRRYETANGLAADLERYLNDEPVEACPPSSIYLIGKFTRRNQGWLSIAAAVLLTVFVGLGVSTYVIAEERDAANASAVREAAAARRAAELAQREAAAAAEAERQRERAEENLRQSRAAVDRLFTRAAEELRNVPHMTEVRRALLEDAAEFYEAFVEQNADSLELRAELGRAYMTLGLAYEQLGRIDDAIAATRKAAELREELAADYPQTPDYRMRWAASLQMLAVQLTRSGRTLESVPTSRRALEVAERLASEHPRNFEYRRIAAQHPVDVANQLGGEADAAQERVDLCRLSLARWAQIREEFPERKVNLWEEGHSHHWLANNLIKVGENEEAEVHLRRSHDIRTKLLAEAPNDFERQDLLAHVSSYLAEALARRGAFDEAKKHIKWAVKTSQSLLDNSPANDSYRVLLSKSLYAQVKILISEGRTDEAERLCLRRIAVMNDARRTDAYEGYHAAWAYYDLGLLQHYNGQRQAAAASFRDAFARFEQVLHDTESDSSVLRRAHAESALRWTLITCPMPQFHDAERSIAYSKESLQQEPDSADYWNSLGIGRYRNGDLDGAIEALAKSIELGGTDDASNYYCLAMAHWRRGDEAVALRWRDRAMTDKETGTFFVLDREYFRREAEKLLGTAVESVESLEASKHEDEPEAQDSS